MTHARKGFASPVRCLAADNGGGFSQGKMPMDGTILLILCLLRPLSDADATLIASLADDSFPVRESAYRQLVPRVPAILPWLEAHGRTHPDPEAANRCRLLANAYQTSQLPAVAVWPWYCDSRGSYTDSRVLAFVTPHGNGCVDGEWWGWRAATRSHVEMIVRLGARRADVTREIERMAKREAKYLEEGR